MSTAVEGKPEKSNNQAATPESSASTVQPSQGLTQDWKHTLGYVAVAAACAAITFIVQWANRPAPIKEYGKVGQEFYSAFVDPTEATSLEVFTFDTENVRPVDFRVEKLANGRWVIPSHHNYPADAEEQLAKTATSVIGISRGAMVTRWPADHGQYGVVNPKQDSLSVDEVEGLGQRITLGKGDESVLADFIIGKQVEGETGQYYVRHPDEDEVYITKLDIDLSTKFTDWIETDLFDFSNGEILKLTVNDYAFEINELTGRILKREAEISTLTRDKTWSDDWKLDSLDDATEELDKDAIRETLNAIADLEVVGVRPKQEGLTPELQLDEKTRRSQQAVNRLQQDLIARGFLLQPGETDDSLSLISREGELFAGTDDGLVYRMHFGRVFTGSQEELEIGFASSGDDAKETTDAADDGDEAESGDDGGDRSDASEESDTDGTETDSGKPGRYLFVRVEFDKAMLGDEPTKPVEPEKSEALIEAEKAEAEKDEAEASDEEASDEESSDESEESEEESELEKLQKEFEEAKSKYEDDIKAYDEFQTKVKDGLKKAEELNRRFAEWYYVIPGESFDKLKLARADLVKAKEEESSDENQDGTTSDSSVEPEATEAETESVDEVETAGEEADDELEAANDTESDTTDAEPDATADGSDGEPTPDSADTGDAPNDADSSEAEKS